MTTNDAIYNKFKTELDAINKYINNRHIYNMFHDYGMTVDGIFVALDSNINVYEACFIALIIDTYVAKYKPTILNVLEIGFAFGTSAVIILNSMLKSNATKKQHTIIDAYQKKDWNNIGIKHVREFLQKQHIADDEISVNLLQENSVTAGKKLTGLYNIAFIDGSHEEEIVKQDLINTDRVLVTNGIVILDDVKHDGVKQAILWFVKNYKNYRRVIISTNTPRTDFVFKNTVYDEYEFKKSFNAPNTMFAFMKQ